ncbi:major facilitator superfamily transporter [Rhizoctonia solani]|uniref:Major facilitator superfamily transporter n=1 Tax=Rhizoctonia solani TaxID=456999 RepID=A0A8H8NTW9_9AGAM|nr:major facilitator superfamily transporter [Rhizoctonia solani]QRW18540.1 major facilitator superfamily transporter [Rhizoctonia solani]
MLAGLPELVDYCCRLPLGVVAGPITDNEGRIAAIEWPKFLIMSRLVLAFIATVMLLFSFQLNDGYWPLIFLDFIIGSAGTAVVFVLANISIFQTNPQPTRPKLELSSILLFNLALQLIPHRQHLFDVCCRKGRREWDLWWDPFSGPLRFSLVLAGMGGVLQVGQAP